MKKRTAFVQHLVREGHKAHVREASRREGIRVSQRYCVSPKNHKGLGQCYWADKSVRLRSPTAGGYAIAGESIYNRVTRKTDSKYI